AEKEIHGPLRRGTGAVASYTDGTIVENQIAVVVGACLNAVWRPRVTPAIDLPAEVPQHRARESRNHAMLGRTWTRSPLAVERAGGGRAERPVHVVFCNQIRVAAE